MLYNKEQLAGFISQTREVIVESELLLAQNPKLENAGDVRRLIKNQKKSLAKYMEQLQRLENPTIGVTKEVTLTLLEEEWEWLEKQAKRNKSDFLSELISDEISRRK